MAGSPSLAARAALAVALLIGFYLLALTISAVLLWIPYEEFQVAHRVTPRLLIVCVLGAGIILWSIVPRPDRFAAPGPTLQPAAHPGLFEDLAITSRMTEQRMPEEVFLVPEVNAWVAERGGFLGFGSRRVMGLGLPLLQALTVSEMRAVLAHEFGHYYAGDTRLGPWIYRTRATIGRTLQGLEHHSGLLQKPFRWYGMMFLRATHAVSRAQEFAADALAARVAGAAALQSGLRHIHAAAQAFGPYWQTEVVPVLEAGFRPPLAEGFLRFTARPAIASTLASSVEDALREASTDPYDTHPPLAERIAAVEGIGAGSAQADSRPAIELLSKLAQSEEELVEFLAREHSPEARFEPLKWEDVGPRVVLPSWASVVQKNAAILSTLVVDQLPEIVRSPDALAAKFAELDPQLSGEARRGLVLWLLGVALGMVAVRNGGAVRSLPGEPIMVSTANGELNPMLLIHSLSKDEISPGDWQSRMAQLGIAGRRLA
jgi:heat shock protein HtpX